jgi:hypothetical protein
MGLLHQELVSPELIALKLVVVQNHLNDFLEK